MNLASRWPVKIVELLVRKDSFDTLQSYCNGNLKKMIDDYEVLRITRIGPRHGRRFETVGTSYSGMCKIAVEFPIWADEPTTKSKLRCLVEDVEKTINVSLIPLDGLKAIFVWDDGYDYNRIYGRLQNSRTKRMQVSSVKSSKLS